KRRRSFAACRRSRSASRSSKRASRSSRRVSPTKSPTEMRLRVLLSSAALSLCVASAAVAQTPLPTPDTGSSTPGVIPHSNFHLSADALGKTDDQRFTWQTHFGGDIDIVDYVIGRANMLIDYEAVLGNEIRAFDPNQGNYTLEGSASVRAGATEIAGIFHHVS